MMGGHEPDAEWSTQSGMLAAYAVTSHGEELGGGCRTHPA